MMHQNDIASVMQWWLAIFLIGSIFLPLTIRIFKKFEDQGYIFSKTLGLAIFTYSIYLLGTLHLATFSQITLIIILSITIILFVLSGVYRSFRLPPRKTLFIWIFEEALFLAALMVWSYIKAFQPDIHGLEKFMDFGFMNSILRTSYFPAVDMWFSPMSINYYYFGHLVTAVLIKLTSLSPYVSYNLMLSSIFAFTITSSFSIVYTLTHLALKKRTTSILAGILGGILTALGGNLHTIYALFKPYEAEKPVPFWNLVFNPSGFNNNVNAYWYPNATRFIPFTIHEFPSYSFVVSDLHGHVLDIPFVLISIALIFLIFIKEKIAISHLILISFFLAVMYMTNAWDGIIYFGLLTCAILLKNSSYLSFLRKKSKRLNITEFWKNIKNKETFLIQSSKHIAISLFTYIVLTLPFSLHFKPFVSGFGILCAPSFLVKIQKIGPFLFEANHCQKSPLYQLGILYGFFYILAILFVIFLIKKKRSYFTKPVIFVLLLIFFSSLLIIAPEFIYAKDIYPAHYRANTMFKLGYQAFIMLSLCSSFIIAYLLNKWNRLVLLPIFFVLLFFILIYPRYSIDSYFAGLKNYVGLDGISYLKTTYPDDYAAILEIQKTIKGQPVILEAQGDSYTDYGRISSYTGLPTVLGWTVHEWLWRGDYSIPEPRIDDVKKLYTADLETTKQLIKKYNISYIYVGRLEEEKYPEINASKFEKLGKVIYQNGSVKIYKVN